MSLTKVQEEITKYAQDAGRDPSSILLVAVSKGHSVEEILELYNQGIRDFGESRVQEALEKKQLLPQDIRWHMIGTLQTKKAAKVVGLFHLIHSVDSFHLAEKINQSSQERGLVTDILLQVNTSNEPSKHGMKAEVLFLQFGEFLKLPHVRIKGLMTMAPAPTKDNKSDIENCFSELRKLKEILCTAYPDRRAIITELSMGMSQDYQIAIQEGATCLRIGSALFL